MLSKKTSQIWYILRASIKYYINTAFPILEPYVKEGWSKGPRRRFM